MSLRMEAIKTGNRLIKSRQNTNDIHSDRLRYPGTHCPKISQTTIPSRERFSACTSPALLGGTATNPPLHSATRQPLLPRELPRPRLASPNHPVYSASRSVGERRPALPPKAQFHPKTLRQKDRGTRPGLLRIGSETRRRAADSAISTARRSRRPTEVLLGDKVSLAMRKRPPDTLESGVNSAHRWGKSLRYRGQRGETQDSFFRFTPFPFPETALNKASKGLIC